MNMTSLDVAKKITDYCIKNQIKFIFISGNGASGKTELSKLIATIASEKGIVNTIDMDDFVVDTKLRSSAKIEWCDKETGKVSSGKYSTVFKASYFLQNILAILCNLERGNNYWHWPKKAQSNEESVVELKADALFTIVEGIGSVYIPRSENNAIGIFITCTKEAEIERRVQRARFSNEQNRADVERQYDERNEQFKNFILPYANMHELQLNSCADFSFDIMIDKNGILF